MAPPSSTGRLGLPFWTLVAGSVVVFIGQGMLFPVLPRYVHRDLGGGGLAVGFAVSSFAIGAMVARPLGGLIADRLGRRLVAACGAALWAGMVAPYPVAGEDGRLPALGAGRVSGGVGGGVPFVGMIRNPRQLCLPAPRRGERAGGSPILGRSRPRVACRG